MDHEKTGDFKNHDTGKEVKKSNKQTEILKKNKRDMKFEDKQKIQTVEQQTSSGKKTV